MKLKLTDEDVEKIISSARDTGQPMLITQVKMRDLLSDLATVKAEVERLERDNRNLTRDVETLRGQAKVDAAQAMFNFQREIMQEYHIANHRAGAMAFCAFEYFTNPEAKQFRDSMKESPPHD